MRRGRGKRGTQLLLVYAAGRIAFGAGAMLAPRTMGSILMGDAAREPAPRTLMGNFGTRDLILGTGLVHALKTRRPADSWLAAGVAADTLDTVVQLREWSDLPAGKRAAGVAFAASAAAFGAGLLARE